LHANVTIANIKCKITLQSYKFIWKFANLFVTLCDFSARKLKKYQKTDKIAGLWNI